MTSINKIILIGNVGALPEVKKTQSRVKVVSFSLATNESWKDKEGNRQIETEWHKVIVFNEPLCDFIEKHVGKGDLLYVEGQLKSRTYKNEKGLDVKVWEVVLPRFSGDIKLIHKRTSKDDEEVSLLEGLELNDQNEETIA